MKGDFSRVTFDRKKHYNVVLMQQGRVQMDADWNEQQAITHHHRTTTIRDVIGLSGTPLEDPGFKIQVVREDNPIELGRSRYHLEISRGRYYVDGILCENEADVAYENQPDLPDAPNVIQFPDEYTIIQIPDSAPDTWIVYLDVWQRHLTALDDPRIREVALGGPDTATRLKTVWQVKILPITREEKDSYKGREITCDSQLQAWDKIIAPSTGGLEVRTRALRSGEEDPCLPPPSAGYRRLENQLYRVEVHDVEVSDSDPPRRATFKWSRDNGSVVTAIEAVNGNRLTVHDVGPDEVLGFAKGQWVEIVDNATELNGKPGQLLRVEEVNSATRVIRLQSVPTEVNLARHPKLRRWDSAGALTIERPAAHDGWIDLEGGIQVRFSEGNCKTGDYWLIPARMVPGEIGEIEWPPGAMLDSAPVPQPPLGVQHHYCRLALLWRDPQKKTVEVQDCRPLFRPLTEVPDALHVIETNWENDDEFSLTQLLADKESEDGGLRVKLDKALTGSPEEVVRMVEAAMIVTLEVPWGGGPVGTTTDLSFLLDGAVSVTSGVIRWRPRNDLVATFQRPLAPRTRLRMRVVLKGHLLWSGSEQHRVYLDGQAFGKPGVRQDGKPRTALILPSCNRARASDFESWLWLFEGEAPPASPLQLTSVTFLAVKGKETQLRLEVSPLPILESAVRMSDVDINVIELTFNRAVLAEEGFGGPSQPQSVRVELVGPPDRRVPATLAVAGNIVRLTLPRGKVFSPSQYRLTVLGDDDDAPAVRAQDDRSALDGDFRGGSGGNFVLNFNLTL